VVRAGVPFELNWKKMEKYRSMTSMFVRITALFVWLINHQYFSLRTNQPPAISQQYFSLRTNQHQPNEQAEQMKNCFMA
jgi:hypothetical protein